MSGDSMSHPVSTDEILAQNDAAAAATATALLSINTSNHVYIASEEYAWIPARVVEFVDEQHAVVSIPQYRDEQSIQSDGGRNAKRFEKKTVPLSKMLLQNVDDEGQLKVVDDMVDLPFLHEVRTN